MATAPDPTGDDPPALEKSKDTSITPTAHKSNNEESESRLLSLPAELRNRIYELAVVQEEPISIVEAKPDFLADQIEQAVISRATLEPILALVSRQVGSEVLPTFYCSNTFQIRLVQTQQAKADASCCAGCQERSDINTKKTFGVLFNVAIAWLLPRVRRYDQMKRVSIWCGVRKEQVERVLNRFEYRFKPLAESAVGFNWDGWTEVITEHPAFDYSEESRHGFLVREAEEEVHLEASRIFMGWD